MEFHQRFVSLAGMIAAGRMLIDAWLAVNRPPGWPNPPVSQAFQLLYRSGGTVAKPSSLEQEEMESYTQSLRAWPKVNELLPSQPQCVDTAS
jgi:hypothetical protein